MFLQMQHDRTHQPVEYMSPSLNDAQNTHRTPIRKHLAMVRVVLLLWPYLQWCLFIGWTGDDTIKWVINSKELSGRLVRWALRLS